MSQDAYFVYQKKEQGICILRCYAKVSRIVIPRELDGEEVTEIASYAFAQEMDEEPENPGELPCICGELVEEVLLPDTIRRIGRYVFYNCRNLKSLSFYTDIAYMGAGAFTGCKGLCKLIACEAQEEKSCLREILVDLNQTVVVEFKGSERYQVLYPAFFEEAVENTPARIIETHTHGVGIQYRNAFQNTQIDWKEYDRLFDIGKYNMEQKEAVCLAAYRLMGNKKPEEKAAEGYRSYLEEHLKAAAEIFLMQEERQLLVWLAEEFVTDVGQMDMLVEAVQENAELLSLFMDISHNRFTQKTKGFSL